ncbi:hypothetical protein [Nocardia sp. NPDC050793]|uniref:hypothetical protein n=1 Tax=Nocardia sp. NPDC050793 TaxID=3155159 RepID=UPI0033D1DC70
MTEQTQVGKFLDEAQINVPNMLFDDAARPEGNELLRSGVDFREEYYREGNPFLRNVGVPRGQTTNAAGETENPNAGILAGTPAGDMFEGLHKVFGDGSSKAAGALQAWGAAGSLKDAANIAADISKGITLAEFDPFDYLGSMLMGWVLEHVEPMRKALDSLAGNPGMVTAYSESWSATSEKLAEVAVTWTAAVADDLARWVGAAADAYRAKADSLIADIIAEAALADLLSGVNEKMSKVVDGVRGIVTEILGNLAGILVEIAAILIATAGTASPGLIARAVFEISAATMTVSQMLVKMASALISLGALFRNLVQMVTAVVGIENETAEAGV